MRYTQGETGRAGEDAVRVREMRKIVAKQSKDF